MGYLWQSNGSIIASICEGIACLCTSWHVGPESAGFSSLAGPGKPVRSAMTSLSFSSFSISWHFSVNITLARDRTKGLQKGYKIKRPRKWPSLGSELNWDVKCISVRKCLRSWIWEINVKDIRKLVKIASWVAEYRSLSFSKRPRQTMTNNSLRDWGLANILAQSRSTNIAWLHSKRTPTQRAGCTNASELCHCYHGCHACLIANVRKSRCYVDWIWFNDFCKRLTCVSTTLWEPTCSTLRYICLVLIGCVTPSIQFDATKTKRCSWRCNAQGSILMKIIKQMKTFSEDQWRRVAEWRNWIAPRIAPLLIPLVQPSCSIVAVECSRKQ